MLSLSHRATAGLVALCALVLGAAPASAQATNYSAITSAVDWGSAVTALMAIAALLAVVLVARKGIRFVLGIIK